MAVSPKTFFSTPILMIVIAVLGVVSINLALSFALLDNEQKNAQVVPAAEAVEQIPFHQGHQAVKAAPTGFLGLEIMTVDARTAHHNGIVTIVPGVLVVRALPEFAAFTSGFNHGDIITHVNGFRITDSIQLRRRIAATEPGTRISVQVLRDGDPIVLYPTVGEKPKSMERYEQSLQQRRRCPKRMSGEGITFYGQGGSFYHRH